MAAQLQGKPLPRDPLGVKQQALGPQGVQAGHQQIVRPVPGRAAAVQGQIRVVSQLDPRGGPGALDGIRPRQGDPGVAVVPKVDPRGVAHAGGVERHVVDGQIRITYKPTHADASTEIKVTGGNDTLGIMAGSYIGFADGNKLADKMVKGISQVASVASLPLNITLTDGRGNPATIQVGTSMTAAAGADLVESEQFVISANNILMNASVAARVDIVNDSIAFTSNYLGDYNDNNGSIRSYIEIATNPMLLSDHLGYKDGAKLGDGDTNYRIRVVDNSPSFQVGANAGQQMHVSISNMSSRALGIDKLDMSTSEGAQVAIEKIDIALSRVSAERSKLGAYNNRLDYTMSNLENTASNLTDAESRIRDVDMASEIISYTSSQIMQQAGTAMLAQANGMGQSVLSLLG